MISNENIGLNIFILLIPILLKNFKLYTDEVGKQVVRTKEALKKMTWGWWIIYIFCYLFITFNSSITLTQRGVWDQGRAGRTLQKWWCCLGIWILNTYWFSGRQRSKVCTAQTGHGKTKHDRSWVKGDGAGRAAWELGSGHEEPSITRWVQVQVSHLIATSRGNLT